MSTSRVVLGLVFLLAMVGTAPAQVGTTQPQVSTAPAQIGAGPSQTVQTFAFTTSDSASCINPPGPCGTLVALPIVLRANSSLIITFSARASVSMTSTQTVETQIDCDVDGNPCAPDANGVQFVYPVGCCDTRSFTWVLSAGMGPHTVHIKWGTLNNGTSIIGNRTLAVVAVAPQTGTPPPQTVQTFTFTTSDGASCINPPGPCGTLVALPIVLGANSSLIITFSARGVVAMPSTQTVETLINCDVDGNPCAPDANGVEFVYPRGCCDTRSFTWVSSVGMGPHTVHINWTTLNTGTSLIQNRTLAILAVATQARPEPAK